MHVGKREPAAQVAGERMVSAGGLLNGITP